MSEVTRPVIRYFGGKWRMAPWVIEHLPRDHRVYVEPFGGAGSVLLRKDPSYQEVWNDLDGELVNLFRVLRDESKAEKLIRQLELTPFARAEFLACYEKTDDPVEMARRLVVRAFQGHGSDPHTNWRTGFRTWSKDSGTCPSRDWANHSPALWAIVDRLRGVTIESRPAVDLMEFADATSTLFYVDPPYPREDRSRMDARYEYELTTADHEELGEVLRSLRGMVVVSGYHGMYDRLLEGWPCVEAKASVEKGGSRTEVLWLNEAAWTKLDEERNELFSWGDTG